MYLIVKKKQRTEIIYFKRKNIKYWYTILISKITRSEVGKVEERIIRNYK